MTDQQSFETQRDKDKDLEILEFIRKNPLARELEIATSVKLSRSAVHNRIMKLRKARRLRSGMTVDFDALGFDHKYRIDIHINPRRLRRAVESARKAIAAGKNTLADIDKETNRELRDQLQDGKELFEAVKKWPDLKNHQEILAFHILTIGDRTPNLLVEDVSVLLGDPADLSAIVRVRRPQKEERNQKEDPVVSLIYRFVTEELRGLASIDSSSTRIEAWSCSHEMQKHLLEERPKRTRGKKTAME